jgi:circadian clock protein KaiC
MDYNFKPERVKTGTSGLDTMLGGGVWRGSSSLLIGPTGSGKTTMALQFALGGAMAGEPALYVNFQENPNQLGRVIKALDPDRRSEPHLHLLYNSAVELQIDRIIVDVFRRIETHRIRRVVIDAVGDLAMAAADPQRIHDYLYALVQRFAAAGITNMLLMEDTFHGPSEVAPSAEEFSRLSYMCDNLILLEIHRDQRLRRLITVYKTRASGHDDEVKTVILSEQGARVE